MCSNRLSVTFAKSFGCFWLNFRYFVQYRSLTPCDHCNCVSARKLLLCWESHCLLCSIFYVSTLLENAWDVVDHYKYPPQIAPHCLVERFYENIILKLKDGRQQSQTLPNVLNPIQNPTWVVWVGLKNNFRKQNIS